MFCEHGMLQISNHIMPQAMHGSRGRDRWFTSKSLKPMYSRPWVAGPGENAVYAYVPEMPGHAWYYKYM